MIRETKICDLCGRETNTEGPDGELGHGSISFCYVVGRKGHVVSDDNFYEDICPQCIHEIISFIKNMRNKPGGKSEMVHI